MIGLGCQIIEGELEEAKINAIGYTIEACFDIDIVFSTDF